MFICYSVPLRQVSGNTILCLQTQCNPWNSTDTIQVLNRKYFTGFAYHHVRQKHFSLHHLRLTCFVQLKNVNSYFIVSVHPQTLSSVETRYLTRVRVQEVLGMLHSHLLFCLLIFIGISFSSGFNLFSSFSVSLIWVFLKQSMTSISILILY